MTLTGIGGYNPIANRNVFSNSFSIYEFPNSMTTKGQSKLSEEEIKEKLLKMARRDLANGVVHNNSYRSESAEWLKLEQDYVSFASPDRKGIINKTLSRLAQQLSMMMPRFDHARNLLKAIMQNSRLFGTRDIGNNFINFRDAYGNVVAMWSEKGWTEYPTDAELSRSHEFMQMWYDARMQAGSEYANTASFINSAASGYEINIGAYKASVEALGLECKINMTKLAAHGITYDAETGQTHVDRAKLQQVTGRYEANMIII